MSDLTIRMFLDTVKGCVETSKTFVKQQHEETNQENKIDINVSPADFADIEL